MLESVAGETKKRGEGRGGDEDGGVGDAGEPRTPPLL
jgi:hypothetical protein